MTKQKSKKHPEARAVSITLEFGSGGEKAEFKGDGKLWKGLISEEYLEGTAPIVSFMKTMEVAGKTWLHAHGGEMVVTRKN